MSNILDKKEQKTKEYLNHMNAMVKYWSEVENQSAEDKIKGFAFSMLVEIDGGGQSRGYDLIDRETGLKVSNGYLHEIMNKYEE